MSISVNRRQSLIEEGLLSLQLPSSPANLYDPIRYMLSIGGKRMRPVLLLMGAEMFGVGNQQALAPALGIEVFHNFTLLHDDIMDKAPLRRGKATIHEKWSPDIAILSGDTMFVKSCQLMMQVPSSVMPAVMSLFFKTAMEVCEGQQLDMDFQSMPVVSIDQYLNMIRLKTAVLLGGSLGVGALIGNASAEDVQHLYDFGVNLGVAFQLQDDILDVYGDAEKFGKQVGGDILANKKTFLLLTALELADGDAEIELKHWLAKDGGDDKVIAVTGIFNRLGILQRAQQKMDDLYREAMQHLDAIPVPQERKSMLRDLAMMLMQREQ
jgi:geranylgeranyl diphosphate synthase type II